MTSDAQLLASIIPFLIPVIILELGLMVFALVDLIKRKYVTGGNKILWVILIIFVQIIGPALYLIMGRKEGPVDSDKE